MGICRHETRDSKKQILNTEISEMIWAENIEPMIPKEAKHTKNDPKLKPPEPQFWSCSESSKFGSSLTHTLTMENSEHSEGFPASGRQSGCLLGGLDVFSKELQSLKIHNIPQLHQLHIIFVHVFSIFYCSTDRRLPKSLQGWQIACAWMVWGIPYNSELSCSK